MKHVRVLPYPGWAACELEPGFAGWLLEQHAPALVEKFKGAGPVCAACCRIVQPFLEAHLGRTLDYAENVTP